MAQVKVTGADHIVVNVADGERSLDFYLGTLGLEPVRVEEWRRGEAPFPSARVSESMIVDLLETPRTGENVNHFCLIVDPVDLDSVAASGEFTVVDGPARRFGARGVGTSLYIADPDGNVIELRHYG